MPNHNILSLSLSLITYPWSTLCLISASSITHRLSGPLVDSLYRFVSKILIPTNYPHLVISGSGDGTLRVWHIEDGSLVYSHDARKDPADLVVTLPCAYYSKTSLLAAICEG